MNDINDVASVLSVPPWVVRWLCPTNDVNYTERFMLFKISALSESLLVHLK